MPRTKKSKSKAKKPKARAKKKKPTAKARPKAKPKAKAAKPKAKLGKPIGKITHFFPKIKVAVLELKSTLKQGDKIKIVGHGKEFEQTIASMQIEHEQVKTAKKGQSIGLKVKKPVKEKDLAYKA